MDFETARFNMVEQQVRPWEVLDQAVLDRLAATPRERFVPEEYLRLAYADTSIPLGAGEVMMPPREKRGCCRPWPSLRGTTCWRSVPAAAISPRLPRGSPGG